MSSRKSAFTPTAVEESPSAVLGCSYDPARPGTGVPDEFAFEGDHEALRGNKDYLSLLRAFAILQAQKAAAVRDSEALLVARDKALEDPLDFVKKLQRGEFRSLPGPQTLAEVPDIDWDKYKVQSILADSIVGSQPDPRGKKSISTTLTDTMEGSSHSSSNLGLRVQRNAQGRFLVRGRSFDDKKPKTFNQPWTAEEQQRLEELLVQYPSEDVEMMRWKKIAAALGNRTAIQVQSRTQKYFLKLAKAGLPIPGRQTKSKHNKYASGSAASQKNSTFFPNLSPAVKMTEDGEDEEEEGLLNYRTHPSLQRQHQQTHQRGLILNDGYYLEEEDVSDEDGVAESLRSSKEYQELLWLKRVRREHELERQRPDGPHVHRGFRCDGCGVEPILGGRFQCADCVGGEDTIDFCCECAPKGLELSGCVRHKSTHQLKPVRKRNVPGVDTEYWQSGSYLDTNFVR